VNVNPDGELAGRIAVITGGGQGLGAGIVEALAARGAVTVVNDLAEQRARTMAAAVSDAGGTAIAIAGDVSRPDDVDRLVAGTREAFGPIDIFVNNAAVSRLHGPVIDHTLEDWDNLFAVNVRGVFLCCKAVLPEMIERRAGNIVNIASISAFRTTISHVAYAASKAAVVTMTRDIAAEVAGMGVRVNAVAPGPIGPFRDAQPGEVSGPVAAGVLVPKPGQAADIGNAVAFLVSDAASFIVGETLPVAGGADLKFGYRV
jgi:NAD(P)-dependent dehydrogenase (short-subunit alcohol dehydrogenase family)